MQVYHDINVWRDFRRAQNPAVSFGFVPTMGNLHSGHCSLVQASKNDNHQTVVSLFVNPSQFNNPEDFKQYPRTLDADLAILEESGVDHCLVPDAKDIYNDNRRYLIDETQDSLLMEGEKRPGHFSGVLTVVMKLFNLVQPNRGYFGEKDYQQLQLIRDMTSAFFMNLDIIACPTVRLDSGLAFSSRNNRLTAAERIVADRFAEIFHQENCCDTIYRALEGQGIKVDYITEHQGRRFAAAYVGEIRLIDNYALHDLA